MGLSTVWYSPTGYWKANFVTRTVIRPYPCPYVFVRLYRTGGISTGRLYCMGCLRRSLLEGVGHAQSQMSRHTVSFGKSRYSASDWVSEYYDFTHLRITALNKSLEQN